MVLETRKKVLGGNRTRVRQPADFLHLMRLVEKVAGKRADGEKKERIRRTDVPHVDAAAVRDAACRDAICVEGRVKGYMGFGGSS